jgi:lipopolysaccharide transport protein LptA
MSMVLIPPKVDRALVCLCALLGASIAGAAPTSSAKKAEEIQVEADQIVGDIKNQTTDYKNVVIRQDDIEVRADHAHAVGLPRGASEWTLDGNVSVRSEQRGSLHSDQAVVEYKSNLITKVTVSGAPAEFEQKRDDSDQTTHGHANEIVYNVADGTIRLSKDASLTDGRSNEMNGELLVYDIRNQKVQASTPAGGKRVTLTISPSGKPEPKPQP